MKKQKTFFILITAILILSLFGTVLIKSQNEPTTNNSGVPDITGDVNPETGIPKTVEKVQDIGNKLSDEDQRTAYLKQEWQKILEKSKTFGPIVKFILKLDPVSDFILGMPIAFSWYFFLTLVIWIAFIVIIFQITSLFDITNKLIHYLIAIGLIAAISYYRYPKSISGFIIILISLLSKTWWMQYVIIGIVILIIILATYFSTQLKIIMKAIKEKHEKNMQELEKGEFKNDAKFLETFRKEMSKP